MRILLWLTGLREESEARLRNLGLGLSCHDVVRLLAVYSRPHQNFSPTENTPRCFSGGISWNRIIVLFFPQFSAVEIDVGPTSKYCTGILAPVLAEVLYDTGGPAVPLLVFSPIMAIAAIAAGESCPPVAALNDVQLMMGMRMPDAGWKRWFMFDVETNISTAVAVARLAIASFFNPFFRLTQLLRTDRPPYSLSISALV